MKGGLLMGERNHHFETMWAVLANVPLLLLIIVFEVEASFRSDGLAINAQLLDVLSDTLSFLFVASVAFISGVLDWLGREHKKTHREQPMIALINLAVLAGGVVLLTVRSALAFGSGSHAESSLENGWILIGPLLAPFVYWIIQRNVKKLKEKDLTAASLHFHVKSDVAFSLMVLVLTGLGLFYQESWLNPTVGLLVSLVLCYFCWELSEHIWKESKATI